MMKLLFLSAGPHGSERLRTDAEIRTIRERLADLGGAVEIIQRGAVRAEDIHRALEEAQPDVVHFSGHGVHGGDLLLETTDGGPQRVSAEAVADVFRVRRHRVRLAVLNACTSEPLAERVAAHVDCVVGTAQKIWDDAAIHLAAALYRELAGGRSVGDALAIARNVLHLKGAEDADTFRLCARPGVDPAGVVLAYPFLLRPTQRPEILLHLDLISDNAAPTDDILARLPAGRAPRPLRATQFGARTAPHGPGMDFAGAAAAVSRMLRHAREVIAGGQPARYYIAGRAPLPLFTHLGLELSVWADDIVLLNQRDGGAWDILHLHPDAPPQPGRFFEVRRGIDDGAEPSEASGRLVVFLSTRHALRKDQLDAFLLQQGATRAGVVELRASAQGEKYIHAGNATQVMQELSAHLRQLKARYPSHDGLALLVAGPATLAFMVGRALNRHLLQGDVWVPNYDGAYHEALRLPFRAPSRPAVSDVPAHVEERRRILGALRGKIAELQQKLTRDDLPPSLDDAEAQAVLARLRAIEVAEEPREGAFDLRVAERRMAFGEGLLDILRARDPEERRRIALCLLLHEIFHVDHGLTTETHQGVGRAGVALEELDYHADAMAVGTLAAHDIRRKGDEGRERAREIVLGTIDAVLFGMEAFDRSEQGDRLDSLPERRLRRYLTWHLQRARALTLAQPEDLRTLLHERLIAELAPLRGHLDERFDKIVDGAREDTELFVVLSGRLLRVARRAGFEPGLIVEAVRAFDWKALEAAMSLVRGLHPQVLTPWAP